MTFSSCSKDVREMLGGKNIKPPSCLRCTVLRKESLSSQARQRGYNKLTFILENLDTLKNVWYVAPNTRHSGPENSLQMLLLNVNNSQ